MLDPYLERAFSHAVEEARSRGHEYITLEHLLYGIISVEPGRMLLDEVGINIKTLSKNLETFFSEHLPSVSPDAISEVAQTIALQRVIQRAFRQKQSSSRDVVEIGDILANILEEEGSFAAYYIAQQGVTRLDILEHISFGIGGTEEEYENEDDDTNEVKALKSYTVDLTQLARDGKLDPLVGRRTELGRAIQVLARRRKNNPLFVGDSGVGKTALVEGLAQMIVDGSIPEKFKEASLFSLDLGGMMAGAKYRGDFEARLKAVMAALKKIPQAILFIDEIHTIVGAGAVSGGSLDASNILKPALAAGELRCIGSTTHEELRNHFEKDRALARRFQSVTVPEPSEEECLEILLGLQTHYEQYHGVRYDKDALEAAISLSVRYLTESRLPDKAIDLIDEAGARKHLDSEKKGGAKRAPRVTLSDIEAVVSSIARIPSVRATTADKKSLKTLATDLKDVVFGQNHAVDVLSKAVLRSKAGFTQAGRPQGSFLFYGPTGVGKTELAKQLAHVLGVEFMRYDMSEYMEKHAVARLIGSPPGYVGFEQGGLLISAIRKTPNAVLLLDEIEKAHPDIYNILLQVMDYATLTDATGRKADFRNVTLIMTSNAGAFEMSNRSIGFGGNASSLLSAEKAKKVIERTFSPEFRNRLDAMVPFASLSQETMGHIVTKFTSALAQKLLEHEVTITFEKRALSRLAQLGYDPGFGARPLARVIREEIEDVLAGELLFGKLVSGGSVVVGCKESISASSSLKITPIRDLADDNLMGNFTFSYAPKNDKSGTKKAPRKKTASPAKSSRKKAED